LRQRPFLQREPDCFQNAVEFIANLMVPKPQHSDSVISERIRTRSIANSTQLIIMPATIRLPALPPENRNRVCSSQADSDGEICIPQNFDSGDAARECAQCRLPFFATCERGSRNVTLAAKTDSEKADEGPLTSILSPQAGRGG
jgi:hypothetical protein